MNIALKGMDTLRVMGPNRIVWLNLTGAENETAAHLAESPRMTLMWCSFAKPMVLRSTVTLDAYSGTPHGTSLRAFPSDTRGQANT